MEPAGPRRRRSFKPRRNERAECGLTDGEKRRLMVYTEKHGISEADLLRRLLFAELDRAGIKDPGPATVGTDDGSLFRIAA